MPEPSDTLPPAPQGKRTAAAACPRCGVRLPRAARGVCPQCGLGGDVAVEPAVPSGLIHDLWEYYWRVSRWAGLAVALSIAAPLSRVGVEMRGDVLGLCLIVGLWIWTASKHGLDLDPEAEHLGHEDPVDTFRFIVSMAVGVGATILIVYFPRPTVVAATSAALVSLALRLVPPRTALRIVSQKAPDVLADLRWTRLGLVVLQIVAIAAVVASWVFVDHPILDGLDHLDR